MDILSPRLTRVVTEWTFRFVNREAYTVKLEPTDSITSDATGNFVISATTNGITEETVIHGAHLLTHSVRKWEEEVFAKGESPVERFLAEQKQSLARNHVKEQ